MLTTGQTQIFQALQGAIERKREIILAYQKKSRFVVPVMLGRTRDNRTVLQAYQTVAYDGVGEVPDQEGWRFFYLDQIQNVVESIHTAPEVYDRIVAKLDLKKSEDGYKPPAFVAQVITLVKL